jgi:DNA repair protein RadA/Sms
MVDVVMAFEGERSHQYRILRNLKNRFGPVDEIGVFAMEGHGLAEVGEPVAAVPFGAGSGQRGFPAIEGTRPVLVEIQALIVRLQSGATPRRAVVGWDNGRLAMLLAVLEARCGLNFSSCEVYLNVAGGYRLADPAADLAVAAALVSALADKPLPARSVWFGEVSLAGEIRPVAHGGLRLREAAKLGFSQAYGPEESGGPGDPVADMKHRVINLLPNLVDRIVGDE